MSEQPSIWKSLLEKGNKTQLLIVLLVGILLLVIAIPTGNRKSETAQASELESRLERILSKTEGVGQVNVMISVKEKEQVEGVVVVSEGADNAVVVRNITEIVKALFPVDSHKIKVIKRNQTK